MQFYSQFWSNYLSKTLIFFKLSFQIAPGFFISFRTSHNPSGGGGRGKLLQIKFPGKYWLLASGNSYFKFRIFKLELFLRRQFLKSGCDSYMVKFFDKSSEQTLYLHWEDWTQRIIWIRYNFCIYLLSNHNTEFW